MTLAMRSTHPSQGIFVAGATVLYDYIYKVDWLPQPGNVANILNINDNQTRHFGGTAFNIAVQLAKLGENVSLGHPVGKDFPGSDYELYLLNLGIQLENLQITSDERSGFAYVFFTEDGSTLCFSYPTQSSNAILPKSLFKQIGLIVLTPRFSMLSQNLIKQAVELSIPVAIVGIAEESILELLPQTMMLSLNNHEAEHLSKALGGISVEAITTRMPGIFYETKGKKGCNIYQHGEMIGKVDAISPKEFVDPTGAGDSFSAGVLAGLRHGFNSIQAAQIGATAASFILEAYGCQTKMPDWVNISERLGKHHPQLAQKIVTELNI